MESADGRGKFNKTYRTSLNFQKESANKHAADSTWTYYDSPLYDAQLGSISMAGPASFESTFRPVLPEGETDLRAYIETTLSDRKGKAIGVEFGGPGSKLFSGFSKGFFEKSIGVSILGRQRTSFKKIREFFDEGRGHSVFEADVLNPRTYIALRERLPGEHADLIIQRMMAGLNVNVKNKLVLSATLRKWYELLNTGGLLFAQVPYSARDEARMWVQTLKKKYRPDQLDVSYFKGESEDGNFADVSAIRLRKGPDAPDELPLLSARTVREISKKNAGKGV